MSVLPFIVSYTCFFCLLFNVSIFLFIISYARSPIYYSSCQLFDLLSLISLVFPFIVTYVSSSLYYRFVSSFIYYSSVNSFIPCCLSFHIVLSYILFKFHAYALWPTSRYLDVGHDRSISLRETYRPHLLHLSIISQKSPVV